MMPYNTTDWAQPNKTGFKTSTGIVLYCFAAQCTATFLRSTVLPEFRYYQDVKMPIKFWPEAYFFRLEFL